MELWLSEGNDIGIVTIILLKSVPIKFQLGRRFQYENYTIGKLRTSAIIVHFDLWNKKRGLTLKVHAFFIWKAIQYNGVMVSGVKTLIPGNRK